MYIRSLHGSVYTPYMPLIFRFGTVEIYAGRKVVDLVQDDVDEIYDLTFVRGVTLADSYRVSTFIRDLVNELPPQYVERYVDWLFAGLDELGHDLLDIIGREYYESKPFVVIEEREDRVISVLAELKACVLHGYGDCYYIIRDYFIESPRVLVVEHRWEDQNAFFARVHKEAERRCEHLEEEEFEECYEELYEKLVEEELSKAKPKIGNIGYFERGKLVTTQPQQILALASDLLPEYEHMVLKGSRAR